MPHILQALRNVAIAIERVNFDADHCRGGLLSLGEVVHAGRNELADQGVLFGPGIEWPYSFHRIRRGYVQLISTICSEFTRFNALVDEAGNSIIRGEDIQAGSIDDKWYRRRAQSLELWVHV